MAVAVLTRCQLRKWCIHIGEVWLVTATLAAVCGVLPLSMFQLIAEAEYRAFSGEITPAMMQFLNLKLAVYRTCFCGISIIAIFDGICSIMLITGARKDLRGLVLPWVMEQLALMPVGVVLMLCLVAMSFVAGHLLVGSIMLTLLPGRIGMTLHSILMVLRLYEELKQKEETANLTQDA